MKIKINDVSYWFITCKLRQGMCKIGYKMTEFLLMNEKKPTFKISPLSGNIKKTFFALYPIFIFNLGRDREN